MIHPSSISHALLYFKLLLTKYYSYCHCYCYYNGAIIIMIILIFVTIIIIIIIVIVTITTSFLLLLLLLLLFLLLLLVVCHDQIVDVASCLRCHLALGPSCDMVSTSQDPGHGYSGIHAMGGTSGADKKGGVEDVGRGAPSYVRYKDCTDDNYDIMMTTTTTTVMTDDMHDKTLSKQLLR